MKEYQKVAIFAGALTLFNLGVWGLAYHMDKSTRNAPLHENVKQYPLQDERARELKKYSIDEDQRWFHDNVIEFGGPVYPPLKD